MRFAAAVAVIAVSTVTGWTQGSVAEPEFADIFFGLDAGKLIPLERQTAVVQGKVSGFIVMNSKVASDFPGAKSPVRFPSGRSLDFVVRTTTAASHTDPNS